MAVLNYPRRKFKRKPEDSIKPIRGSDIYIILQIIYIIDIIDQNFDVMKNLINFIFIGSNKTFQLLFFSNIPSNAVCSYYSNLFRANDQILFNKTSLCNTTDRMARMIMDMSDFVIWSKTNKHWQSITYYDKCVFIKSQKSSNAMSD